MSLVSRTDAEALIPEEVAQQIIDLVPQQSAALRLFNSVSMSRKQQRLPVLAALPTASFVNGDTGLKPVTNMSWANKFLEAEPVAAIVAIPEDVLDDSAFDIFAQVKTKTAEAIGRALDAAIFFGTGKPSSWPTAIVPAAVAAGNMVARGTASKQNGGIAEDLNQLMGKVEDDGFDPSGYVANRSVRKYLRGARDLNGQKLLETSGTANMIDAMMVEYLLRGDWPTGANAAEMITGDFTQGIIATRSDITFKVLTEASLYNPDGSLMFALPQQDMVAVRVVARYAFQVANILTRENPDPGTRYPFAVLRSPGA